MIATSDRKYLPCCGAAALLAAGLVFGLLAALSALIDAHRPAPAEPLTHIEFAQRITDLAADDAIRILDRTFTDAEIAQGATVYATYCAACHGADARGQFPDAPLEPDATGRIGAPPHDTTGHTWHHSDTLLIRYVHEGGFSDLTRFYLMPPFGDILTDDQALFVLAYIKTLWTPEQRARQRLLTEEEQRLFSE